TGPKRARSRPTSRARPTSPAWTSSLDRRSDALAGLRTGGLLALREPRERAEEAVPVGRADAEARRVVLEVVAHVELAQAAADPGLRLVMVQVVVGHVVDQVTAQEPAREGQEQGGPEHGVEPEHEQ